MDPESRISTWSNSSRQIVRLRSQILHDHGESDSDEISFSLPIQGVVTPIYWGSPRRKGTVHENAFWVDLLSHVKFNYRRGSRVIHSPIRRSCDTSHPTLRLCSWIRTFHNRGEFNEHGNTKFPTLKRVCIPTTLRFSRRNRESTWYSHRKDFPSHVNFDYQNDFVWAFSANRRRATPIRKISGVEG